MQTKTMFVYLAIVALLVVGCSRETSLAPEMESEGGTPVADPKIPVELEAGSVDELAAAVAEAGPGGVILVLEGMHTESGTVEIPHRLTIIGEPGATLMVSTTPDLVLVDPALWVHGAGRVVIRGLEIIPSGAAGSTGILVDNSTGAVIADNTITDFTFPVIVEQGDRCRISGNTINGAASEGYAKFGILMINGKNVHIDNNDVQDGLFGIWANDEQGTLINNTCHDNVMLGILCCNAPPGVVQLQDGRLLGAEVPCTKWIVQGNDCSNNGNWGIMVIHSAADNHLVQNSGTGNGMYDIYLVGESFLWGACTGTSTNTVVVSTQFPNMTIADDAEGSHIVGGILVEDPLHVPCP